MQEYFLDSELEKLKNNITVPASVLQGAEISHGTNSFEIKSIFRGIKNLGSGAFGEGFYTVLRHEDSVAREYAHFTPGGSKGVILEGRINPNKNFRVAQIKLSSTAKCVDIKNGVFPIDWNRSDPRLRSLIHNNFDIIMIVDPNKVTIEATQYLLFKESSGQDAILWQSIRPILKTGRVVNSPAINPIPTYIRPQFIAKEVIVRGLHSKLFSNIKPFTQPYPVKYYFPVHTIGITPSYVIYSSPINNENFYSPKSIFRNPINTGLTALGLAAFSFGLHAAAAHSENPFGNHWQEGFVNFAVHTTVDTIIWQLAKAVGINPLVAILVDPLRFETLSAPDTYKPLPIPYELHAIDRALEIDLAAKEKLQTLKENFSESTPLSIRQAVISKFEESVRNNYPKDMPIYITREPTIEGRIRAANEAYERFMFFSNLGNGRNDYAPTYRINPFTRLSQDVVSRLFPDMFVGSANYPLPPYSNPSWSVSSNYTCFISDTFPQTFNLPSLEQTGPSEPTLLSGYLKSSANDLDITGALAHTPKDVSVPSEKVQVTIPSRVVTSKPFIIPPPKNTESKIPEWVRAIEITGSLGGTWLIKFLKLKLTCVNVGIGIGFLIGCEIFNYIQRKHEESKLRRRERNTKRAMDQCAVIDDDFEKTEDAIDKAHDLCERYLNESDPSKKCELFSKFRNAVLDADRINKDQKRLNESRINNKEEVINGHKVRLRARKHCEQLRPLFEENSKLIDQFDCIVICGLSHEELKARFATEADTQKRALISACLVSTLGELVNQLFEKDSDSSQVSTIKKQALDNIASVEALIPNNAGVLAIKGNVYLHANEISEARECFNQAIELSPNNIAALAGMISADLVQGAPSKDIFSNFARLKLLLLNVDPDNFPNSKEVVDKVQEQVNLYTLNQFQKLMEEGNVTEAEALIKANQNLSESDKQILQLEKAYHYLTQKDYESAIKYFQEILSTDKDNRTAQCGIFIAILRQGNKPFLENCNEIKNYLSQLEAQKTKNQNEIANIEASLQDVNLPVDKKESLETELVNKKDLQNDVIEKISLLKNEIKIAIMNELKVLLENNNYAEAKHLLDNSTLQQEEITDLKNKIAEYRKQKIKHNIDLYVGTATATLSLVNNTFTLFNMLFENNAPTYAPSTNTDQIEPIRSFFWKKDQSKSDKTNQSPKDYSQLFLTHRKQTQKVVTIPKEFCTQSERKQKVVAIPKELCAQSERKQKVYKINI